MVVHLLRHACARQKGEWPGDDSCRPLDEAGRAQADAVAAAFAAIDVRRVLSSPARRCVETVRPLAAARTLSVETTPVLEAGTPLEDVLDLLIASASEGAVLCTQGETMRPVLS